MKDSSFVHSSNSECEARTCNTRYIPAYRPTQISGDYKISHIIIPLSIRLSTFFKKFYQIYPKCPTHNYSHAFSFKYKSKWFTCTWLQLHPCWTLNRDVSNKLGGLFSVCQLFTLVDSLHPLLYIFNMHCIFIVLKRSASCWQLEKINKMSCTYKIVYINFPIKGINYLKLCPKKSALYSRWRVIPTCLRKLLIIPEDAYVVITFFTQGSLGEFIDWSTLVQITRK